MGVELGTATVAVSEGMGARVGVKGTVVADAARVGETAVGDGIGPDDGPVQAVKSRTSRERKKL
jgi:hypothetical protein